MTALCNGRHLRGENLEIWRLNCNVLTIRLGLYLLLIYSLHGGWVLPVGGTKPRTFAPRLRMRDDSVYK